MNKLQLVNDDFTGRVEHLRHACRGILIRDGSVLLCHESKEDKYIIPGGGVEGSETKEQCCEREMLEETGIIVKAKDYYLEIEELFADWRHFNHYFICQFVKDTGKTNLTEAENRAGYKTVWMPLPKAIETFGQYEKFHATNLADFGLYRREFHALKQAKAFIDSN